MSAPGTLHVGWKAIGDRLGVHWLTAKRTYYKKHRMPVVHLPNGKPSILEDVLVRWFHKLHEVRDEKSSH